MFCWLSVWIHFFFFFLCYLPLPFYEKVIVVIIPEAKWRQQQVKHTIWLFFWSCHLIMISSLKEKRRRVPLHHHLHPGQQTYAVDYLWTPVGVCLPKSTLWCCTQLKYCFKVNKSKSSMSVAVLYVMQPLPRVKVLVPVINTQSETVNQEFGSGCYANKSTRRRVH